MEKLKPENASLERLKLSKLKDYLMELFNIEKGWLYTFWELTIHPGKVINNYLFHDRSRLVKPVGFLLLSVAVSAFLTVNFIDMKSTFNQGFEAGAGTPGPLSEGTQKAMDYAMQKMLEYFNVLILVTIPFLALSSYIFFKKFKYFYTEHLVINMYLAAYLTFWYILLFPLYSIIGYNTFSLIYIVLWIIYIIFTYIRVFQCKTGFGIFRSIVTYFLYLVFHILIIAGFQIVAMAYYLSTQSGG